jgi:hypothetical protein
MGMTLRMVYMKVYNAMREDGLSHDEIVELLPPNRRKFLKRKKSCDLYAVLLAMAVVLSILGVLFGLISIFWNAS